MFKEHSMATTASDTDPSPESATEALKRRKKQARREAKLMSEIEAAKKDLKKAQKKQSKAQARLEELSATLHTLEELRAHSSQGATGKEPTSLLSEENSLPESSVVMIDAAKLDALS
jgi:seryl-tRNA synthetase